MMNMMKRDGNPCSGVAVQWNICVADDQLKVWQATDVKAFQINMQTTEAGETYL